MTDRPPAAVFLSYASQDAEAARRICEALRAAGVEVWFDQNELVGGDAWDQKIRGQVKTCALFVPIISASTQARLEGYFRLEWKLAAQRTHTMADAKPFLLPVVIDATGDAEAHVPEEFRAVQWTRLPGGETPEKFCARVKSLLNGSSLEPGRPRPGERGEGAASPIKPAATHRAWLVPVLIVAAAVVALALWQPWKKSAPASASLTEAQQLVAKARKILDDGDELNRETYTFAEELLKKAETLDVTEASAWALHTQVSANFYNLGWDVTATRQEAISMQAGRAAKLAPGTLEAELAGAAARVALNQNRPEVQEQLRQLARTHPTDIQVLRQLVRAYGFDGKSQEATETALQALKLAPDDPALKADLVNYLRVNNRFAEADAAIVSGLKGRVNARLLIFETWLRLYWRGDTAGAVAAVAKWPAWLLAEDRGAALAAFAHLWHGDSARAIQVLQALPRDEVRDSMLAGPRAAFIALAYELAGQADSAAASWRIALQVAQRRLASAPDDIVALHWQAWAQARLGDTPAAARGFRLLRERSPLPSSLYLFGGLAGLAVTTGHRDEAFAVLGPTPYSGVPTGREPTKAILRITRVFDPLRDDARFQALVAAAPGPEEKKETKPTSATPTPAASANDKSLVVLPLENLSPDPENAFFTEGVHTEIIASLSRNPDLDVKSRDTAVALRGVTGSLADKARRAGAANVITGSVRRAGGVVRVQLELRRASDEALLWSLPPANLSLADALALQETIANEVARALQAREAKGSYASARFMTRNPEAFDLFKKSEEKFYEGVYSVANRTVHYPAAIRLAEQALAADPNYSTAAELLANIHTFSYNSSAAEPAVRVAHATAAKQWGERASRLLPGGAGDAGLAYYYITIERDNLRGLQLLDGALRALPNEALIHNRRGLALMRLGRAEEALAAFRRAQESDPLNDAIWRNVLQQLAALRRREEFEAALTRPPMVDAGGGQPLARFRFMISGQVPERLSRTGLNSGDWRIITRQFEAALTVCDATLAANTAVTEERFNLLVRRAAALAYLKRPAESVTAAQDAVALAQQLKTLPAIDRSEHDGRMATALALAGQSDEAIAAARRYLTSISAANRAQDLWGRETAVAAHFARLNRPRECLELLTNLLRVPSGLTVPMLKVDPAWDNVREDPAFKALLADPKNNAPL